MSDAREMLDWVLVYSKNLDHFATGKKPNQIE